MKIKKITKGEVNIPTYDFEVKNKHHYLLDNGCVSHNTGLVMGAVASYLPPHAKMNYQTLADLSVPVAPRYLKDRWHYYRSKSQYGAHQLIKATKRVQRWIDTGVSMEVFINPAMTNMKLISDEILSGFKSGETKAVYYSLSMDGKEAACEDCAN